MNNPQNYGGKAATCYRNYVIPSCLKRESRQTAWILLVCTKKLIFKTDSGYKHAGMTKREHAGIRGPLTVESVRAVTASTDYSL